MDELSVNQERIYVSDSSPLANTYIGNLDWFGFLLSYQILKTPIRAVAVR